MEIKPRIRAPLVPINLKRRVISKAEKKVVWEKTNGHCHFCGKKLIFSAKRGSRGRWNVDHVLQKARGGDCDIRNFLAICRECNRLRWHFDSRKIRRIFRYGEIAVTEVRKGTKLGKLLKQMHESRRAINISKRKPV